MILAAIISIAFVCGLVRSIEADLKWLFRESDMGSEGGKAKAGLRGKTGRHYRLKRARQRKRSQPFPTDPATVEIVNRLRQALKGPIWFYTRKQESDE